MTLQTVAPSRRAATVTEFVVALLVLALLIGAVVPVVQRARRDLFGKREERAAAPDLDARRGAREMAARRNALEAGLANILDALEEGRAYARRKNRIVTAHFSLGTNQWHVASGVLDGADAATTDSRILAHSPTPPQTGVEGSEGWRFLDFEGARGGEVQPSFVFFPDGDVQSGRLHLGWEQCGAFLDMDSSGTLTVAPAGDFSVVSPLGEADRAHPEPISAEAAQTTATVPGR